MKLKNNLKEIMGKKGVSINKLAIDINRGYRIVWDTVNRDTLNTTQLESLVEIAKYLEVGISELYTEED